MENSCSLFIVDDEDIIREGLSQINWESINIKALGSASNGEEALDKIRKLKPDIVISDIRMPKIDGLSLVDKLRNVLPNTKVVLLTGYNEFDYAQKAISLNVAEYILKPVIPQKLLATIDKLKKSIIEEKMIKYRKETFNNYLKESRPFLKNWFLNALSSNVYNDDELLERFEVFGIKLSKGLFQAVTISFGNTKLDEDENLKLFKMFEEINKVLAFECKLVSFFDGNAFTFILNYTAEDERMALRKTYNITNCMKEYLDYNFDGKYSIGIGLLAETLKDITFSVKSSADACNYRYYLGENQIIYIKDVEPVKQNNDAKLMIEEQYLSCIKMGDEQRLLSLLKELFDGFIKNNEDIDSVKRTVLELIVLTSRAIYEVGQKPEMLFNKTDLWTVINRCTTVEQLFKLVSEMNQVVISQIFHNWTDKNKKIVEKVKNIIKEYYADGISLEWVAEKVYLSPCYLSIIFSKETGMTFKEYLIKTRINKSKELLKDLKFKIYEVAQAVGYNDPRYFSDLFRRHTGQSPAQYRESLS